MAKENRLYAGSFIIDDSLKETSRLVKLTKELITKNFQKRLSLLV